MICYRCRLEAGNADICPTCGTDLSVFQRALRVSNSYYNDGLQKAGIRNLSGAITSLERSLKFNKYNTDARNLLGLIYFEMGEAVDALSEWVISKNYQPENNRASVYLEEIQRNQGKLANINQTIRKYNQALLYCRQGSRDLALIQLRKVLTLNPKHVKGHQLMALLYLQEGKLELAKKSLRSAGRIDSNNTLTLRYLKEVNLQLRAQSKNKKAKVDDDLLTYQSGNETIIMPKRFKESSLGESLLYIVIGLVVGIAATCFLIVPSIKKNAVDDAKTKLLEANDMHTTDTQTIKALEAQIETLQSEVQSVSSDSEEIQSQVNSYEQLLNAYVVYTGGDVLQTGKLLENVKTDLLTEKALTIYNTLETTIQEDYMKELYKEGYEFFSEGRYDDAIQDLKKVIKFDMDYEEGKAAYYLAQCYRKNNDLKSAKKYYRYVIENYPGTERAKTAENYVEEE